MLRKDLQLVGKSAGNGLIDLKKINAFQCIAEQ